MTPLLELAYNGGSTTVVILDNRTTAMTGAQNHPGTGYTLREAPTISVDIEKLAESFGFKRIRKINPYKVNETEKIIAEELAANEPSLIIAQAPCALLKADRILSDKPFTHRSESLQGMQVMYQHRLSRSGVCETPGRGARRG